ncbi:MAG: outer membrane protein assembly factor BamD, partial [Candidatus Zixiibacteriota bacterium]
ELGNKAFSEKKYLAAIEYFQTVVFNHGGESFVDTAQYYLALSYYSNREYIVAGAEFNRLALNYPSSVFFENAIFMRASCFFEGTPKHYGLDQSDLETAIKQFEDFIIDFPESALVPQASEYLAVARGRLARKYYESAVVYRRIGALIAAQKYYQVVIDDFTASEFAPRALFEMAEINLKIKKYSEAQAGFANFVTLYGQHELTSKALKFSKEAAFKSGVLAFEKGELVTAKERFESFIKEFPNDNRVDDAKEYLIRIGDKQSLLSEDSHAES